MRHLFCVGHAWVICGGSHSLSRPVLPWVASLVVHLQDGKPAGLRQAGVKHRPNAGAAHPAGKQLLRLTASNLLTDSLTRVLLWPPSHSHHPKWLFFPELNPALPSPFPEF